MQRRGGHISLKPQRGGWLQLVRLAWRGRDSTSHAFLQLQINIETLSIHGLQPLPIMFVRIFPKNEAPSDFEVKGDCAFLTEKIQQTIKDIIQSKTGFVLLHTCSVAGTNVFSYSQEFLPRNKMHSSPLRVME